MRNYLINVDGLNFEKLDIASARRIVVGQLVSVQIAETGKHYTAVIEHEGEREYRTTDGERFSKMTGLRVRSKKNADRFSVRFLDGVHMTNEQIDERDAETARQREMLKTCTPHRVFAADELSPGVALADVHAGDIIKLDGERVDVIGIAKTIDKQFVHLTWKTLDDGLVMSDRFSVAKYVDRSVR